MPRGLATRTLIRSIDDHQENPMTDILDRADDLLLRPFEEALPALRAQGMLPETTTERAWTPNPGVVQPIAAPLVQLDPRKPYVAGKGDLTVFEPQWYASNGTPEVSIRSQPGGFASVIYTGFAGLGANRKCIAWFDLRVYSGASTSITLGGSGNPSTVVVTNQATGGQRTWVPLALTANASGTALAYMVPTLNGHGGAWYGVSLYGL
jgi:hypothetical protein